MGEPIVEPGDPMSAPTRSVDVLVVGAGPAGCAAAVTARRAGLEVVVVDRAEFPRDKICGDGLTTGALRLLDRMGVDPALIPSWTPVTDIKVSGPLGHTVTFPLPRDRGEFAVVARRSDVDAAIALLQDEVQPGDIVLVKASRSIGLERGAAALLEQAL